MKRLLPILMVLPLLLLGGCENAQSVDHGRFDPMMRSLNDKSHGYQIVEDVTGSAPTKLIERFEVRPGDCWAGRGYNDCANDRERSELSQKRKDIYLGSTEWYGWHIFVPKEHVNIFPTKVYMGQFHQKGAKPAWMFHNPLGHYFLDNHIGGSQYNAKLLDETELLGKWNKIEINAKWSDESDGFFKVWVNGKLKSDFVGQTASAPSLYFKYGLYRSFVSRYRKANNGKQPPAQVVYYTNVKRGGTRKSIQ